MSRAQLTSEYGLFQYAPSGIGAFAGPDMHQEVYERLNRLDTTPLRRCS